MIIKLVVAARTFFALADGKPPYATGHTHQIPTSQLDGAVQDLHANYALSVLVCVSVYACGQCREEGRWGHCC